MKKLLSIFLSLLSLTAFAQINIRTGDPRQLIHQSVGWKFNQTTGVGNLDTTTTPIEATWFGAVGDGVTDNHNAFKAWLAAGHVGHRMHLPRGKYLISSADSIAGLWGSEIYGDDTASIIVYNSASCFYMTGPSYNSWIHNINFQCTLVNPTEDFGNATIFSIGYSVRNSRVSNNMFTLATNNADAIIYGVQVTGHTTGSIRGLTIDHNTGRGIGQTFITLQNRDTATIASRGQDSLRDCYVLYNDVSEMGRGGNDGMFITMDGRATHVVCNYNTIRNAYNVGIEDNGFANVEIGFNLFYQTETTNPLEAISCGPNDPATNAYIHDNYAMDSIPVGFVFTNMFNSRVEGNYFLCKGTSQVLYRNSSYNTGRNNQYISAGPSAVKVQGRLGGTAIKNTFTNEFVSNSTSPTGGGSISFDGGNVKWNKFEHPYVNPSTASGSTPVSQIDTATNNSVTDLVLASDTSNFFTAVATVAMTDGDTVITANMDAIAYQYFRVTGTFTATRNFKFSNRVHTNFTVYNSANFPLNVVYVPTSSSVTIPAGQTAMLFNDGTTLRSNLPGSTTGTGAAVYGTSPTIATPSLTGTFSLPVTTSLATNPSIANNTTIATGNNVLVYVASVIAAAKVKPTVASVTGPITSITADSMVYTKAGNALTCSGHFTCTPPASGSCTASVTLPNPSGLVGGHACFGVASWSNGTTNGVSTSVIGAGNGAATVAQITWVSGGASSTDIYYTLTYFQQ